MSASSASNIGNTFAQPGRAARRYNQKDLNKYHRELAAQVKHFIDRHEIEEEKKEQVLKKLKKEKVPPEQRPLKIERVEFYAKDNAIPHHTDKYELVHVEPFCPVLRRGQDFFLSMRFIPRPFNPKRDKIKLVFSFGPHPNIARGSKVELPVGLNDTFSKPEGAWDVRVTFQDDKIITLNVKLPPSLYVGMWKCTIITSLNDFKDRQRRFNCTEKLYVLFNPWCKDDTVFLNDENLCKEYILNDVGKLYMGVHNYPEGRNWVFAQFDDVILPACIYLLDCAKLDYTARGDPIQVVRAISAVINSRDDNGLLVDNWSGDYSDGVAPMDWTGSLKIFEEYMKNGGQPVKYGQCWVFSGCTTTFCRALGIPCRNITNYVSAHDCHHNLTVDKFHDANGDLKTDVDQDTVWNFHVWNEVWMARPDLPSGYGGWQVIDSTPQEQSEDVYQMGPASVEAVRRGEIGLQYDTMFVVSEVNADVIHWQDDEESEIGMRKMKTYNYFIGKKILTKCPDKDDSNGIKDAEEITQAYKNPEGTLEERMQVLNAARNAKLWYLYDAPRVGGEDVVFDLLEIESIQIGEPFNVTVKIENKSKEKRNIFAILSANSVYYTGVTYKPIRKETQKFVLHPKQSEVISIQIRGNEYLDKLADFSMIKIYAMATVRETRQTWAEEDDFSITKPSINLQILGTPKVNEEFAMSCSFVNPLEEPLENCHYWFEGPGLTRPKGVRFRNISAGESTCHEEKFIPSRAGEKKIVVTFGSTQLKELHGSITITVNPV
uniref:protein-glutamine gamma-glutamyltransferase n=1 Tax=Hemiscolopendra marginata TaxID=943146 RepID=A0A646QJF9_9MYRI